MTDEELQEVLSHSKEQLQRKKIQNIPSRDFCNVLRVIDG